MSRSRKLKKLYFEENVSYSNDKKNILAARMINKLQGNNLVIGNETNIVNNNLIIVTWI